LRDGKFDLDDDVEWSTGSSEFFLAWLSLLGVVTGDDVETVGRRLAEAAAAMGRPSQS
jgi:hypothetical protein